MRRFLTSRFLLQRCLFQVNEVYTISFQLKETKEDLDKQEIATKIWKDSILIDDDKMQSGEVFQDLSQYECDQCKESHYHTKRTVNMRKCSNQCNIIFSLSLL